MTGPGPGQAALLTELTALRRRTDRMVCGMAEWMREGQRLREEGQGISDSLSAIISSLGGETGANKRSLEQSVKMETLFTAKKPRTERSAILLEQPIPRSGTDRNGGMELASREFIQADGFIQVRGVCFY